MLTELDEGLNHGHKPLGESGNEQLDQYQRHDQFGQEMKDTQGQLEIHDHQVSFHHQTQLDRQDEFLQQDYRELSGQRDQFLNQDHLELQDHHQLEMQDGLEQLDGNHCMNLDYE